MSYHRVSAILKVSASTDSLVRGLVSDGWDEAQLRRDALRVWTRDGEAFFSLGDWAKVPSDDVEAAVKRALGDDVRVEWDFEAGPGDDGDWEQII